MSGQLEVPLRSSRRASSASMWSYNGYNDYFISSPRWSITSNMKVAPEASTQPKLSLQARPESVVVQRLQIEKHEEGHHGIGHHCHINSTCNTILMVMAAIFIIGGVILTAISYRPRDHYEEMARYKERQTSHESSQTKTVGPIFVIIGLIMLAFALMLYTIRWFVNKHERGIQYELENAHQALQRVISLKVDPPMPTVSYALMGAPGVTMSVPPGAQYNELSEWKKSIQHNPAAPGLEDRIPSRSHSAAAIHFDDHKDKELIKRRYHRRHSLSPNFIVNENNRTYSRGLSNWSETTNSDLEWSFKSTLQGNPALAMEVIADNDMIPDEVDNDPYMQSLASHNFYMFPPTLKRSDIACFPASPSILSPNVSRTASTREMRPTEGSDAAATAAAASSDNPFPLLGDLPQIAQRCDTTKE